MRSLRRFLRTTSSNSKKSGSSVDFFSSPPSLKRDCAQFNIFKIARNPFFFFLFFQQKNCFKRGGYLWRRYKPIVDVKGRSDASTCCWKNPEWRDIKHINFVCDVAFLIMLCIFLPISTCNYKKHNDNRKILILTLGIYCIKNGGTVYKKTGILVITKLQLSANIFWWSANSSHANYLSSMFIYQLITNRFH